MDDICVTFFFFLNYKLVLERLSYLFLFILGGSQFFSNIIGEQLNLGGQIPFFFGPTLTDL